MHKLRVFYRNNKEKIWKVIGISILVYAMILIANNTIIQNKQKEQTQPNNVVQNNTSYTPSETVIAGSTVGKEDTQENTKIIENFITYCNDGKVEEAYALLSQDCKTEIFPTLQSFSNDYYKDIFTEKKSYDLESWFNDGVVTYKIKIIKDILSSGKVEDEYIEDYYTVIEENKEKKLNINNFVNKEEENKEKEINGIKFTIIDKYIYMDYEKYTVKIENNSDSKVTVDTKQSTETVYITDQNGVKYGWYGHEIQNEKLALNGEKNVELKITFNKMYNPKRRNKSISFTDIQIEGNDEKEKIQIAI